MWSYHQAISSCFVYHWLLCLHNEHYKYQVGRLRLGRLNLNHSATVGKALCCDAALAFKRAFSIKLKAVSSGACKFKSSRERMSKPKGCNKDSNSRFFQDFELRLGC